MPDPQDATWGDHVVQSVYSCTVIQNNSLQKTTEPVCCVPCDKPSMIWGAAKYEAQQRVDVTESGGAHSI